MPPSSLDIIPPLRDSWIADSVARMTPFPVGDVLEGAARRETLDLIPSLRDIVVEDPQPSMGLLPSLRGRPRASEPPRAPKIELPVLQLTRAQTAPTSSDLPSLAGARGIRSYVIGSDDDSDDPAT